MSQKLANIVFTGSEGSDDLVVDFSTGAGLPIDHAAMHHAMDRFSGWVSHLNRLNARPAWWAYASTARNLLSSSLGMSFVRVVALVDLAAARPGATIRVRGTTRGERLAIGELLHRRARSTLARLVDEAATVANIAWAAARSVAQLVRVFSCFAIRRLAVKRGGVDIALFTYIDSPLRPGFDAYYGALPELLGRLDPSLKVRYFAHVYTPYRERLRELRSAGCTNYTAVFDYLWPADYIAALGCTLWGLVRPGRLGTGDAGLDAFTPILRENLIRDVSHREYVITLLTARASKRFVSECGVRRFIYPYESKSLEHAILIALRELDKPPQLIGYQHTSITPRHVNLLLNGSDRDVVPLPDRIVTIGEVTRTYLQTHGGYPSDLLRVGCALRQQWPESPITRQVSGSAPRVLLALSSSRSELQGAVKFLMQVKEKLPGLELGIRPHVNFPLSELSASLASWTQSQAVDLSGTSLSDNLAWCDLAAYISSTVALEALLAGRPVVKLAIDPIDPDPLLGEPPLRSVAAHPDEFIQVIEALSCLSEDARERGAAAARRYASDYFKRPSEAAVAAFLED